MRRWDIQGWAVSLLAMLFLLLGALFLALPGKAALLFGIDVTDGAGLAYVRALGARDTALAGDLAGLLVLGDRRCLGVVLGASVVIPLCDLVIVGTISGTRALPSLAAHGAAALVLAALAWWCAQRRR
jgi:hypothetical protein